MQQIFFEEPYKFIPPVRGPVWPFFLKRIVRPHLRRHYQVNSVEFRGLEHYQESLRPGTAFCWRQTIAVHAIPSPSAPWFRNLASRCT